MDAKHHKSDPMNYAVYFKCFIFLTLMDQIQQLRRPEKLCIYLFKLWTCSVCIHMNHSDVFIPIQCE